jgi:hypothetical protein
MSNRKRPGSTSDRPNQRETVLNYLRYINQDIVEIDPIAAYLMGLCIKRVEELAFEKSAQRGCLEN